MDEKQFSTILRAALHDGRYPLAGIVIDAAGNIYGTTANGGHGRLWNRVRASAASWWGQLRKRRSF